MVRYCDLDPPENDDGRPPPGRSGHAEPTRHQSTRITCQSSACAFGERRIGRHADAWREGFAYGFRDDALRLAQREVDDPTVWLTLSRLADRNDRDPDDFGLCGGGR
jgi:hypothetical protein